jgi:type I restriction-modification system DNA methylase subunit
LSLHETRHVVARREIRRYFANVEPNRRGVITDISEGFRGRNTQHHRAPFGSRRTCGDYRIQHLHPYLRALRGVEIVDGVTRLAAMNLILHGVGPTGTDAGPPVKTDDSLRSDPGDRFDLVLTNPPFGKKMKTCFSATR